MTKFKRPPKHSNSLDPTEAAALRDVSNRQVAKPHLLAQLKALGLVEQKADEWTVTHQGQIQLLFGSAR